MTDQFQHLIKACERHCVKDCCGLAAFDFSPICIGAHLLTVTSNENVMSKAATLSKEIQAEFEAIRKKGDVPSNSYSFETIGDSLTIDELNNLEAELIQNIKAALKVIELDANLSYAPETFKMYDERTRRS